MKIAYTVTDYSIKISPKGMPKYRSFMVLAKTQNEAMETARDILKHQDYSVSASWDEATVTLQDTQKKLEM